MSKQANWPDHVEKGEPIKAIYDRSTYGCHPHHRCTTCGFKAEAHKGGTDHCGPRSTCPKSAKFPLWPVQNAQTPTYSECEELFDAQITEHWNTNTLFTPA